MKRFFVIVGKWIEHLGDFRYWGDYHGWVSFDDATLYGSDVFLHPLPEEGQGILELTEDKTAVQYYHKDENPHSSC